MRRATLTPAGSVAVISGTTACARAGDQFVVAVKVEQRGADKAVTTGTGTTTVTCTTAGAPWSALVYPSAGTFKSGNASATAATQQTPPWLAPASVSRSMKLTVPDV